LKIVICWNIFRCCWWKTKHLSVFKCSWYS